MLYIGGTQRMQTGIVSSSALKLEGTKNADPRHIQQKMWVSTVDPSMLICMLRRNGLTYIDETLHA